MPATAEMRLPTAGPMNRNDNASGTGPAPPPRRWPNPEAVTIAAPSSTLRIGRQRLIMHILRPLLTAIESVAVYKIEYVKVKVSCCLLNAPQPLLSRDILIHSNQNGKAGVLRCGQEVAVRQTGETSTSSITLVQDKSDSAAWEQGFSGLF